MALEEQQGRDFQAGACLAPLWVGNDGGGFGSRAGRLIPFGLSWAVGMCERGPVIL